MTDSGTPVSQVLAGIDAAARAGLRVKINTVVQRGVNDHTITELAAHFRGTGHTLRFIEFMDVGATNAWDKSAVVSAQEIIERISAQFPLEPALARHPSDVAQRWRYLDDKGEIGVIASVSQPFCGTCTRARLSAEGQLYTCLFAGQGTDVRALLRDGSDDEHVSTRIRDVWIRRNDNYSEQRATLRPLTKKIEMSYIGG
jgi:GTP 3',8-cyclase